MTLAKNYTQVVCCPLVGSQDDTRICRTFNSCAQLSRGHIKVLVRLCSRCVVIFSVNRSVFVFSSLYGFHGQRKEITFKKKKRKRKAAFPPLVLCLRPENEFPHLISISADN